MSKYRVSGLFAALVAIGCFFAAEARSELSISISGGTIDPGGTLSVDVEVSSDLPPEDITEYLLFLTISKIGDPGGSMLEFVDASSQPLDYLTDTGLGNDYIFVGGSSAVELMESPFTGGGNTEITAFDESVDSFLDPVEVSITATPTLLARVQIQHDLAGDTPAEAAGDMFEISIDDFASEFYNIETDSDSFIGTINVGTITVASVAAVPEPSFASLILLSCGGLTFLRRRRS